MNARNRVLLARRNLPAVLRPVYTGTWAAITTAARARQGGPRRLVGGVPRGLADGPGRPSADALVDGVGDDEGGASPGGVRARSAAWRPGRPCRGAAGPPGGPGSAGRRRPSCSVAVRDRPDSRDLVDCASNGSSTDPCWARLAMSVARDRVRTDVRGSSGTGVGMGTTFAGRCGAAVDPCGAGRAADGLAGRGGPVVAGGELPGGELPVMGLRAGERPAADVEVLCSARWRRWSTSWPVGWHAAAMAGEPAAGRRRGDAPGPRMVGAVGPRLARAGAFADDAPGAGRGVGRGGDHQRARGRPGPARRPARRPMRWPR